MTEDSSNQNIMVEVAYALPGQQLIVPINVPAGASAESAIIASGIMEKFPEIDLSVNKIGIFGKLTKLDTVLRDLDRVEIYRPLIADPKEVRRQRAAEGKVMKKGGGSGEGETSETASGHPAG
jgi:putative ubiquitin-RnfH superfamily antitoxin RatB of RatAB toxin-antitoxin module